jgi:choice-of-anchor A domain-containing protein
VAAKDTGLVVGGGAKLKWGTVAGDIYYGTTLSETSIGGNGQRIHARPIDFGAVAKQMRALCWNSKGWAATARFGRRAGVE